MEIFYNKRAFKHNYYSPFIYHIILKKNKDFPDFGVVKGDSKIPYNQPGCAYIEENNFGMTISKSIIGLPKKYSIIKIFQHKVMPDHAHILLQVKDWSPYHLDFYIDELVKYITNRISREIKRPLIPEDIFLYGYCDKPLLLNRSLDGLYQYIKENPHRLAMRLQDPQFFQRKKSIKIGDEEYEAYGNLFLLRNPDKMAIRIRRHFTDEEIKEHYLNALEMGARGTVIVSPFISKTEKGNQVCCRRKRC